MKFLSTTNLPRLFTGLLFFPALCSAQTWVACADTRDAALVLAQAAMTQDLGDREVSGHERLQNDQYTWSGFWREIASVRKSGNTTVLLFS